jgi:hypothetical protein
MYGNLKEALAACGKVLGFPILEKIEGESMNAGVSREIHFTGCAIRQPRFDTSHMPVLRS